VLVPLTFDAGAPLDYDPDAPLFDGRIRIAATPTTGLHDGQAVVVDVSGFYPNGGPTACSTSRSPSPLRVSCSAD